MKPLKYTIIKASENAKPSLIYQIKHINNLIYSKHENYHKAWEAIGVLFINIDFREFIKDSFISNRG